MTHDKLPRCQNHHTMSCYSKIKPAKTCINYVVITTSTATSAAVSNMLDSISYIPTIPVTLRQLPNELLQSLDSDLKICGK